ncbi:hypothetical protein [Victivallis sp. Marseille-Q1083]|uniref:hypothetical protein n=1 Tax=Victivallis sp. Marseille-Q1083 TaxID=2717288 RepID=UPI00158C8891|nr:hypothetical protein [Victivallis sp. Marseille-Q1083]
MNILKCFIVILLLIITYIVRGEDISIMEKIFEEIECYNIENKISENEYIVSAIFLYHKSSIINNEIFWNGIKQYIPKNWNDSYVVIRYDSIDDKETNFILISSLDMPHVFTRINLENNVIFEEKLLNNLKQSQSPISLIKSIFNQSQRIAIENNIDVNEIVSIKLVYDIFMYDHENSNSNISKFSMDKDVYWLIEFCKWKNFYNFSQKNIGLGGDAFIGIDAFNDDYYVIKFK